MNPHAAAALAQIRQTLQRQRDDAAKAERQRLEAERTADRQRRQFELAVGAVTPLAPNRQPSPAPPGALRPPPQPTPRQRQEDEAQALVQALSDEFDVESLLETDAELSYRRPEIPVAVLGKLRRGTWSLQAQIDLHGLRSAEAREALGQFLHQCGLRGLRCVRVVHGKGHGSPGREGVLRVKVRRWLVQRRDVLAFVQARPVDGGAGALLVLLQGA